MGLYGIIRHISKMFFRGLIVILVFVSLIVAEELEPHYKPTITITRTSGEINIDGQLKEAAWQKAAIAENYSEHSPAHLGCPDVRTRAMITYDDNNLYVALIAFDNPGDVRVSLSERDNIFSDDYMGILFCTYGDQSWGYELFVNPLGHQGDGRTLIGGDEDMSFDVIYESKGIVTDSGYQVEVAIPFASLCFPDREVQSWRINFWRDRQRENRYKYSWAAIDPDDPCFMCQWGYMEGLQGVHPSSNFEIIPTLIGTKQGEKQDVDNPDSEFKNHDLEGETSLNLRYSITTNSSFEAAYNPDFSQVESDAGQIDVNNTYALYYSEKRPFFQQGAELFESSIDVIYTRSIYDPLAAVKFNGQFNKTSLAYLAAYDEKAPYIVPTNEGSYDTFIGDAVSNIFRLRHIIGDDSYVGIMATDQRQRDFNHDGDAGQGGSGSTYGADFRVCIARNYIFKIHGVGSHIVEPDAPDLVTTERLFNRDRNTVALDGETFDGYALDIGIMRDARHFHLDLSYNETSPTFRAPNGFVTQADVRQTNLEMIYQFFPNREWLVNWYSYLAIGRVWDHTGHIDLDPTRFIDGTRDEWIIFNFQFLTKGNTYLTLQKTISREKYAGVVVNGIDRNYIIVNSRFSEILSIYTRYMFGPTIYRSDDFPERGFINEIDLSANFKPTQRLKIEPSLAYSKMSHGDHYMTVYPEADRTAYSGYIFRTRTTYFFSREWNLRFIVQYNDFSQRLDIEPLITWQLNPYSVFYVGVNSHLQYYDPDDYETLDESKWKESTRQFFVKFQYLFRV